jgi:rhamnose transport system ATP-binding protein
MAVPLLEVKSITKSYAGVRALKNGSFELFEGEVHALIGENGAGKSTLIKIITGAVQPDSGSLSVCGQLIQHNDPSISRSLGISAIYQQPSLFPDLTVAENIALALEGGSAWRKIDWKQRNRRAAELMERAGASIHPEQLVSSLSMPEQQLVEIAKAIGADANILIMDEPTASLTDREVDSLFKTIGVFRNQGAGIIYISHRLEEITTIADRITVMRDGETISTRRREKVDKPTLISMMVGREIEEVLPKRETTPGEIALELRQVSNRAAGVRDISLAVRCGEILGFAGLVGSGRTQLAEMIFGLTPADTGEILLAGLPVKIDSPAQAIHLGIGYVPEDRRRHGVVLEMPIASNISLANLKQVSHLGLINEGRERELASGYLIKLRIKAPSVYTETGALSGGNQQKVALARWLSIHPRILILDEPTQGVDVGSKSEIHNLIRELAARAIAIIMISSELPEILSISDRIAVMHQGTIAGVLTREEATPQKILSIALGHTPSGEMAHFN